MKCINSCEVLLFISLNYVLIEGKLFFASDYGAYSDDNIDDTYGIQMAVNEAIKHGFRSQVIFGAGIYNLSSKIAIDGANNLTVTGQGMDKTTLLGSNPVEIFSIYKC